MNILFCCEGFIVDGVTSYNLYMSSALRAVGHQVAVIGRWGGMKGFQRRHEKHDVKVLQDFSLTVFNSSLLEKAVSFQPDIIITDSRRAFPFSQKLRQLTGAKIITIFHDPPQLDRKGPRNIQALIEGSDMWFTSEKPILNELKKIQTQIPKYFLQRPITNMVSPSPLKSKDPFNVLCLGRLSRWKSPGIKYLVANAHLLRKEIPTLQLFIVGGGRRLINFKISAARSNLLIGDKVVHILGTRTDPTPWFEKSTIVCAGATSAIEAILSNRPVIAFSGVWMGPVTEENLEYGAETHFGERDGEIYTAMNPRLIYLNDHPEILADSLIEMYKKWDQTTIRTRTETLRQQLYSRFDSHSIGKEFTRLVTTLY